MDGLSISPCIEEPFICRSLERLGHQSGAKLMTGNARPSNRTTFIIPILIVQQCNVGNTNAMETRNTGGKMIFFPCILGKIHVILLSLTILILDGQTGLLDRAWSRD